MVETHLRPIRAPTPRGAPLAEASAVAASTPWVPFGRGRRLGRATLGRERVYHRHPNRVGLDDKVSCEQSLRSSALERGLQGETRRGRTRRPVGLRGDFGDELDGRWPFTKPQTPIAGLPVGAGVFVRLTLGAQTPRTTRISAYKAAMRLTRITASEALWAVRPSPHRK